MEWDTKSPTSNPNFQKCSLFLISAFQKIFMNQLYWGLPVNNIPSVPLLKELSSTKWFSRVPGLDQT